MSGYIKLPIDPGSLDDVVSVNGQTGVVVLTATDVGADAAGTAQALFDTVGDKYVRTTRFENIVSGTSGTVTLPANSEIVLDDFGGTTDAVVAQVSGGKPTLQSAKTASGEIVATSFNSLGDWSFTGTPSSYPVAILYRVRQKLSEFDSTASNIYGSSNVEQVTKADLGLGNVDNTSDLDKVVSIATQNELDLKVNGPLESLNDFIFGAGTDGNVTLSSGTTVLTQDAAYNNLTINGTGKLSTNGFRVFVKGILDLTAAPPGAIEYVTTNGNNANVTVAGAQAGVTLSGTIGSAQRGQAAQAGGTGAGVAGGSAATTNTLAVNVGGRGGAGGLGASGAGGAQGGIPTIQNTYIVKRYDQIFMRGTVQVGGGSQGSSGGSGGGDGTAGGGSGSSGSSGGIVWIAAKVINRGLSTSPGTIRALGGNGGNGGTPAGGNRGGGGGGAGGTGGYVFLAFNELIGSVKTQAVQASGGSGGNGGNGTGTGIGGNGGGNGGGGTVFTLNIGTSTYTRTSGVASTVGSTASGTTGGAGAAVNTFGVDL